MFALFLIAGISLLRVGKKSSVAQILHFLFKICEEKGTVIYIKVK